MPPNKKEKNLYEEIKKQKIDNERYSVVPMFRAGFTTTRVESDDQRRIETEYHDHQDFLGFWWELKIPADLKDIFFSTGKKMPNRIGSGFSTLTAAQAAAEAELPEFEAFCQQIRQERADLHAHDFKEQIATKTRWYKRKSYDEPIFLTRVGNEFRFSPIKYPCLLCCAGDNEPRHSFFLWHDSGSSGKLILSYWERDNVVAEAPNSDEGLEAIEGVATRIGELVGFPLEIDDQRK